MGLSQCFLAFDISDPHTEIQWIFGDAFHREYYHIYDMKDNQIGLAKTINDKAQ